MAAQVSQLKVNSFMDGMAAKSQSRIGLLGIHSLGGKAEDFAVVKQAWLSIEGTSCNGGQFCLAELFVTWLPNNAKLQGHQPCHLGMPWSSCASITSQDAQIFIYSSLQPKAYRNNRLAHDLIAQVCR